MNVLLLRSSALLLAALAAVGASTGGRGDAGGAPSGAARRTGLAAGALFSALAIVLLKEGVVVDLGYSWRNVAYGAASSVVGLLISFYAAAIAGLLGAIVAVVHERRHAPKT